MASDDRGQHRMSGCVGVCFNESVSIRWKKAIRKPTKIKQGNKEPIFGGGQTKLWNKKNVTHTAVIGLWLRFHKSAYNTHSLGQSLLTFALNPNKGDTIK